LLLPESNKEIAPRFKKALILPKEEIEEVELRPTSMLFNKATVKTNNMMNIRTIETNYTQSIKQPPAALHKEPLPIKQVSSEKPKQSKKDKVSLHSVHYNTKVCRVSRLIKIAVNFASV
jgi:hypothetical protein